MENIYLDYNASTPIDRRVSEAMIPFLSKHYGNPSTNHWAATHTQQALHDARQQVASLLGCALEEIIFTSGGSEANNHVLKGVFHALREKGRHIVTTKIEHPAILEPCHFLEGEGAEVTYVDVDRYGRVSLEQIERSIKPETILVSIMHANNEVGTLQRLEDIAAITKKHHILLHTDASQSVGKVPTQVEQLGVDLLTVAGHKLYAPKGVGALYIKEGTPLTPLVHGARHESGRRAGTESILLSVGLGKACELALAELNVSKNKEMTVLRDYFWQALQDEFADQVVLQGHPTERLPNTLNVSFIGHIGHEILERIPQVAASTGAACHSGQVNLSAVLKAMGVTEEVGKGTIRFSLGRYTTKEELDRTVQLLSDAL